MEDNKTTSVDKSAQSADTNNIKINEVKEETVEATVIEHDNEIKDVNYYKALLKSSPIKACKELFILLCVKWKELSFKNKFALLFIFLPTFICLVYFGVFASNMYISETKFAVRSGTSTAGGFDIASQFFNIPTTSSQDTKVVEEYLKSPDAFYSINKDLNLIEHYSSSNYDFISRLSKEPTLDEVKKFWSKVSKVSVNQDSGVISFSVRAYTEDFAYKIAQNALQQSENLINSMNERARQDGLNLARDEVKIAENRLSNAQKALQDFRSIHNDLDLKSTAAGLQSVILELESQAATIRTQISESSLYMQADAPTMKALQSKLTGIERQIELEKKKLTGTNMTGNSINTLASDYEKLMIESEFANKQLVYAMTSYEKAKIELMAKSLYVVSIAQPTKPDESLYPTTFKFTFITFVVLTMIYGIFSVIVAAIKEHAGF